MKHFILSLFLLFITVDFYAQSPLRVRYDLGPQYAIRKILLDDNSEIQVSNIQYEGHAQAIGIFSNSSKYYVIKRGIILSTGNVEDAIGPNESGKTGQALSMKGIKELEDIGTGKTFDGAKLQFEFQSSSDSIYFNYVFASEEYPEFVDKGVNDIFAFFLEDLESGKRQNLAVFGLDQKPVNVDNINDRHNNEFYIPNARWDPNNISQFKSDPGLGELSLTYEYDGFTKLLSAGSAIEPGRRYRITFAIADVGDEIYDSAVFLEAGSFGSFKSKPKNPDLVKLRQEFIAELDDSRIRYSLSNNSLTLSYQINFAFDEYELKADSALKVLNTIARLLKLNDSMDLIISGHTDNIGSEEYNIDLSSKRANFARSHLISLGINGERVSSTGYGDNRPITDNITAKSRLQNRRLEFEFIPR